MSEELGAWAAGLLVDEAWSAYAAGRYEQAMAAAGRAAEAAAQLDDPVLLLRALQVQAAVSRLTGDHAAALSRYTRIMGMAEDSATSSRLNDAGAAEAIADAFWSWVESARFVTGIPVRDLFRVLDAGDRWLTGTGHQDWRASILLERALTHDRLGETDAAEAAAEEALAAKLRHPDSPGYTLNGIRYQVAGILLDLGRAAEAVALYQAVLDDPGGTQWERRSAREGLAWSALEAGDPGTARREASAAVLLAESLGDNATCLSLEVLAKACRAAGDLDGAWLAAGRYLEAAGRIGGHYRPYFAARTAVDIALDRADLATALRLLDELDEHAAALDASAGTTAYAAETTYRRQQLARLTTGP